MFYVLKFCYDITISSFDFDAKFSLFSNGTYGNTGHDFYYAKIERRSAYKKGQQRKRTR